MSLIHTIEEEIRKLESHAVSTENLGPGQEKTPAGMISISQAREALNRIKEAVPSVDDVEKAAGAKAMDAALHVLNTLLKFDPACVCALLDNCVPIDDARPDTPKFLITRGLLLKGDKGALSALGLINSIIQVQTGDRLASVFERDKENPDRHYLVRFEKFVQPKPADPKLEALGKAVEKAVHLLLPATQEQVNEELKDLSMGELAELYASAIGLQVFEVAAKVREVIKARDNAKS